MSSALVIGFIVMVAWTPAMMNMGIKKIENGYLSAGDRVLSFIPIYNCAKAESISTGRISFIAITDVLFLMACIFRFITYKLQPEVNGLDYVSAIILVITLLLAYLANGIIVYKILTTLSELNIFQRIFFSLIFPLGQWFIGAMLPTIVKRLERESSKYGGLF